MASVNGALTWFAAHMGILAAAAALIVPLVFAANLFAEFLLSPHLNRFAVKRHVAVGVGALVVGVFACLALLLPLVSGFTGFVILALGAVLYGVFDGLFRINDAELKKRTLTRVNLSRSMFHSAAISGLITLVVLLLTHTVFHEPATSHGLLLWLAGGAWFAGIAALACLHERRVGTRAAPAQPRVRRVGIFEALKIPWLRRLALAAVVFFGAELAIPFYVIHAATIHAPTLKNALTVVAALGVGHLIGGPLWNLFRKQLPWVVSLSASVIAVACGIAVLIVDDLMSSSLLYLHFVALIFVSIARIGSSRARRMILLNAVPNREGAPLVGTLQGMTSVIFIVGALILGSVADLRDTTWPLMILVALNLLAVVYAATAWRTDSGVVANAP